MAKSLVSIPFSTDGVELGVKDATALPANARGTIAAGVDGAGNTQFLSMDTAGHAQMLTRAQTAAGGTITITGTGSTQTISGHEGHQLLVFSSSGTWSGSVYFQGSVDGTTWAYLPVVQPSTPSGAAVTGVPTNGTYQVQLAGTPYVRVYVLAWTSGSLTLNYAFSSAPTQIPVVAQGAAAALSSRWPVRVTDGTNSMPTMDVAARSGFMRVTDATNTAAVKAASTAAVAADPALVVSLSPNSPVQATIEPGYGVSADITITLASLASSVTTARASTVVSNATDLYEDALFFIKYQTIASASATGYVNVYGYASIDGGTTYSGGATGSDAALTLTNPTPLVLLVSLPASASSTQYNAGPFSFCRLYGLDRLPERWGFVVTNVSGQALSATAANNKISWQGVRGKLA
jgi:hypothetical protein